MNAMKMNNFRNQMALSGRGAGCALFTTLFSTAIIHGFLLERGVDFYWLGVLGTVENVAHILCLLLLNGLPDSFRRFSTYQRVLAGFMFTLPVRALCVLCLFVFGGGLPVSFFFALYALVSALSVAASCFYGMLDVTLVVRVTPDEKAVMRLTGISGIIAGVTSMLGGVLIGVAGQNLPLLMVLAAGAGLIAIGFTLLLREVRHQQSASTSISPFTALANVLHMPTFRRLFPSNVLRGIHTAAVYYTASAGILRFSDRADMSTMLAFAVSFAPFVCYLLLTVLSKRVQAYALYLTGACVTAVALGVMVFAHNPAGYTVAYLVLSMGQELINVCYPLGMYQIVPIESLGSFSAARLLVYMFTNMVFVYIFGSVISHLGPDMGPGVVFALGIAAVLLGGASFFRVLRRTLREQKANA